MSVELESDILAASWDRPELSVEHEATPEILDTPERQEIPRPIEAALELLRKYRTEVSDNPEMYVEETPSPSHYLLQNEIGEHQLFEASLTEESQRESLEILSATDDPELRSLLIDELGLKSAWQEIWPPKTRQSTIESLTLYSVAIAPNTSPEQRSLSILVLAENGRDVSQLEIPHISFSSDDEAFIEELEQQDVEQARQEIGTSTYSVQLMRTHEGFVFYKDGIPQVGIDQSDPRIQAAIDQLLNQGMAVDIEEIESARIRIETTYRCNGDPTTLEIGQFIDVDIESIPFPIEEEEQGVIDDDYDDQIPNETTYEKHRNMATPSPIVSENQSDIPTYDDWFFTINWAIEGYSESPTESPVAATTKPFVLIQHEAIPAPPHPPLLILSRQGSPDVFDAAYGNDAGEDRFPTLPTVTPASESTTREKSAVVAMRQSDAPVTPKEYSTITQPDVSLIITPTYELLHQEIFTSPKAQQKCPAGKQKSITNLVRGLSVLDQNQELLEVMHIWPVDQPTSEPTTLSAARRSDTKPRDPDTFQLPIPTNVQEQTATVVASTQRKESIVTATSEQTVTAIESVNHSVQTKESTLRVEPISIQQSSARETRQNNVAATQVTGAAIKTIRVQTEKVVARANEKKTVFQQVADEKKERTTLSSPKTNRGISGYAIANTQAVEQPKTANIRRSSHSNRATKTYQVHMLPTGKDESAGSVVAAIVERYAKRADLEQRSSQLTIDDIHDAKILREQIRPLGVLIDDIARIVRQFPSAAMHIAIKQQSVVFTPEIANPIDQAALLTRIATLPVSITNRQRLAFIYQLRTVA